jgi:peptidoglycan/xylan/chitin deacetylase (PgdA/CDA1 family)
MEMKATGAAIVNHLGFLDIYAFLKRELTKSQVAILMYHRVSPKKDDWSHESLSPQAFESQMEYFCREYEILPLDDLAQYIHQGKSLPHKAVVVTLDDGYKDNYIYAYPIFKKYHIPATVFITTGHIGTGKLFWWDKVSYFIQHTVIENLNLEELGRFSLQSVHDKSRASFMITERLKKLPEKRKAFIIEKLISISGVESPSQGTGKELILSWDEVREMNNHGITFGAHTVNHPILTNIPLEQAKWEIVQSKRDIKEKLGKEVTTFSYPNGNFNPEIAQFVKESGFTCAVSALPSKLISPNDSPYELSRIRVGDDFNKFKFAFCGLWGDLHEITSRGGLG